MTNLAPGSGPAGLKAKKSWMHDTVLYRESTELLGWCRGRSYGNSRSVLRRKPLLPGEAQRKGSPWER